MQDQPTDPTEKRCTKCGETKPIEAFRKGPKERHKNGRRQPCRACEYLNHRAYVEADREAWRNARREYYREYGRKNAAKRAAAARHRYANDDVQRERILANSARQKARDPKRQAARDRRDARRATAVERRQEKDRLAAKRRRAAERGGRFIENVHPLVLLERADGVCGICGEDVDPFDFHVDHIHPLVRGGEHSYMNTQIAHPLCNLRKGDRAQLID